MEQTRKTTIRNRRKENIRNKYRKREKENEWVKISPTSQKSPPIAGGSVRREVGNSVRVKRCLSGPSLWLLKFAIFSSIPGRSWRHGPLNKFLNLFPAVRKTNRFTNGFSRFPMKRARSLTELEHVSAALCHITRSLYFRVYVPLQSRNFDLERLYST
jgi:hypothetical protein